MIKKEISSNQKPKEKRNKIKDALDIIEFISHRIKKEKDKKKD